MTRITAHMPLNVRELRVDLALHRDHVAGYLLRRFLIAGEIPADVAVVAPNTQGSLKEHHGLHQVRPWLQKLQVLRLGRTVFLSSRAIRLLGKERRDKQQ